MANELILEITIGQTELRLKMPLTMSQKDYTQFMGVLEAMRLRIVSETSRVPLVSRKVQDKSLRKKGGDDGNVR